MDEHISDCEKAKEVKVFTIHVSTFKNDPSMHLMKLSRRENNECRAVIYTDHEGICVVNNDRLIEGSKEKVKQCVMLYRSLSTKYVSKGCAKEITSKNLWQIALHR